MRPSFATQPRECANEMTAPSDSRKRRFFALEMGREGYARSLHEAISERIVLTRTLSRY
jgi:hypothetical protein